MRKAVRKWLRLDTWGWDILRIKRRLGTVIQAQETDRLSMNLMLDCIQHQAEELTKIQNILVDFSHDIDRINNRLDECQRREFKLENHHSPDSRLARFFDILNLEGKS